MAALGQTISARRLMAVACSLSAAIVCGSLVLSASPAARAAQVPLVGPLSVAGRTLVDQGDGGRIVSLQGVNVLATGSGPYVGGFVDPNAVSTLADWGANYVRLALSADQYLQACPNEVYDTSYRSELAQAVQALTSRRIYTVLDIHASNPNCLWSTGQTSYNVPLPGNDTATVLGSLVSKFGSNPLVGYEPFNEPEACAMSTSGVGATRFVPAWSESGGWCATSTQANLAWNGPGTVIVGGVKVLGMLVGGKQYQTPGMDSLYETVMHNLPAGAPTPLVFLDPNGWAASGSTFDAMEAPLASASNLVEVFHPYDCQDTSSINSDGHQSAVCADSTPETCSTTSSKVDRLLTDPATGQPSNRPVVFDEFTFPAGENGYYVDTKTPFGTQQVPILLYQHGYWVNNTIAAMQQGGAAGWALYFFQNADVNDTITPFSMLQPGITPSTPTPWTPNANASPAAQAMAGESLSCESPPLGFG